MTAVHVVVPYRPTPERAPLWEWNQRRWETLGWPITWADSSDMFPLPPFNRAAAVNRAVRRSCTMWGRPDVLVIADADTAIGPNLAALRMAAQKYGISAESARTFGHDRTYNAATGPGPEWAIAYAERGYHGLTEPYTKALLDLAPAVHLDVPTDTHESITSYSGCLIVPMDAFEMVGGYDPRFTTWGEEDLAFMWALDTLWGPHTRLPGFAAHLYHEHVEADRYGHPNWPNNKALGDRYAEARGDRVAMTRLIMERAW